MKLGKPFFLLRADVVAKNLLGKYILRFEGERIWGGKIVEVEAYLGVKDKAAHSYNNKKTERTEIMFRGGGFVYIFFVYGIHWQLNFTCGEAGEGQAVLIRALEAAVIQGRSLLEAPQGPALSNLFRVTNGPGNVAKFLEVNGSFYGEDLSKSERIWVVDKGVEIKKHDIVSAKRVGVDYSGEWKKSF